LGGNSALTTSVIVSPAPATVKSTGCGAPVGEKAALKR